MQNFIVDQPASFSLKRELQSALDVKIIVAFAKQSGWQELKHSLLTSKAFIDIVVGLNFCITEPAVLDDWLGCAEGNATRFSVRVAPESPVFHPKVLIVRRMNSAWFAIVGSGNLTGGGLESNVECGVYLDSSNQINALLEWRASIQSHILTRVRIEDYRVEYKKSPYCKQTKRFRQRTPTLQEEQLTHLGSSSELWQSKRFMSDMRDFLRTEEGGTSLSDREIGAKRIALLLDFPEAKFSKSDWEEFYKIPEFGAIRQSYKNMSSHIEKLREAVAVLTKSTLGEEELHDALVQNGRYHVRGLGENLATKIATSSGRYIWPLFNRRVQQTFAQYGLTAEWGAAGYFQLLNTLRRDVAPYYSLDFWAMDAFCEHITRKSPARS